MLVNPCCGQTMAGAGCIGRHELKRQAIVSIAHRPPKRQSPFILDEHVHGQSLGLWPYRRTQNVLGASANASPATMTNDEELAKINLFRLLAVKCVGHNLACILENDGHILLFQPILHALFQLRDGHAVAMALVTDQLMVEFRQQRAILCCCATMTHRVLVQLPSRRSILGIMKRTISRKKTIDSAKVFMTK